MTPWAPDVARIWYTRLVEGHNYSEITCCESLHSLISSRRLLEKPEEHAKLECKVFVLHRLLHDINLKTFWSRLKQIAKSAEAVEQVLSAACYYSLECFTPDLREKGLSPRQFSKWKSDVSSLASKLAELLDNTLLDEPFGWWLDDTELKRLEHVVGGQEGQRALASRRSKLSKDERYALDTQNLLSDADLPSHSEQLRRLAATATAHSEENYGSGLPSKPSAKYVQVHEFVISMTWFMRVKFKADERGLVSDSTNSLFGTRLDRKAVRAITGSMPKELKGGG